MMYNQEAHATPLHRMTWAIMRNYSNYYHWIWLNAGELKW